MKKLLLFLWLINAVPEINIQVTQSVSISVTTAQKVSAQVGFFSYGKKLTPPAPIGGNVLFVEGGQSNNVFRAGGDGNSVTPPAGHAFEYFLSRDTVLPLAEPTGEGYALSAGGGALPNTALTWYNLTGGDAYFLNKSIGNTSIVSWDDSTEYNDSCILAYHKFMAYAARHSIPIAHTFYHWVQSENDYNEMDCDLYMYHEDKVVKLIEKNIPVDAFLSTRTSYDPTFTSGDSTLPENIFRSKTIYGQISVTPNYVITTNQTATFSYANGKKISDQVHYSQLGQNIVGAAVANAAYYWLQHNARVPLDPEPVVRLQGLDTNTAIHTKYTNQINGPWVYDFQLNGNTNETNDVVSGRFKNWDGSAGTATYDADGIVLAHNGYVLIGHPMISTADFTIEIRAKAVGISGATSGTDVLTGPVETPNSGGFDNKITLDCDDAANSGSGSIVVYAGNTTYWIITGHATVFHTYKIVQNSSANTIELFLDGTTKGTNTKLASFSVNMIGAGHPTQSYGFDGTIDWAKVKSTL